MVRMYGNGQVMVVQFLTLIGIVESQIIQGPVHVVLKCVKELEEWMTFALAPFISFVKF